MVIVGTLGETATTPHTALTLCLSPGSTSFHAIEPFQGKALLLVLCPLKQRQYMGMPLLLTTHTPPFARPSQAPNSHELGSSCLTANQKRVLYHASDSTLCL
jgi:hypothetical protein